MRVSVYLTEKYYKILRELKRQDIRDDSLEISWLIKQEYDRRVSEKRWGEILDELDGEKSDEVTH